MTNFVKKQIICYSMRIRSALRNIVVAAIVALSFTPAAFAAQKGEKVFGVRTGYVSRNKSADIGLYFQYTFSNYFRLQPAMDLVFRHKDRDAFTVDLNGQVPLQLGSDVFTLYPFAGLNFSSWNRHIKFDGDLPTLAEDRGRDTSSRSNYFGVNLGAGFDLKLSPTLKILLEAGYTFVKSNSGLRVLAGIGYVF